MGRTAQAVAPAGIHERHGLVERGGGATLEARIVAEPIGVELHHTDFHREIELAQQVVEQDERHLPRLGLEVGRHRPGERQRQRHAAIEASHPHQQFVRTQRKAL